MGYHSLTLYGTVGLKRGETIPVDLIYSHQLLRAEVILLLVAEEGKVGEIQSRKDLTCSCWFEYAGNFGKDVGGHGLLREVHS